MTATHLVVGGGQAAAWAAVSMRKAGFSGRIILIGDEAHAPYDRPPLSKGVLTEPALPAPAPFHPPATYRELEIDLRTGTRVDSIEVAGQSVSTTTGERIGFDRLLVATGGRARGLQVPGGEAAMSLRTHEDAASIRARLNVASRVVCIGAGVIGLEVASSARQVGSTVTVVEMEPTILGRCVSPEIAAYLADVHRARGVELRLGSGVEGISSLGDIHRVHLSGGDVIEADVVVAGIGIIRNDEIAREAGLVTDNGILVDEHGRSSVETIFAAGDVAAFFHPFYAARLRLESWQHAQNHGSAVGRSMAGSGTAYAEIPWFWTDQHGLNVQVAGFPARAARTVVRHGENNALAAYHLSAEGVVEGITTINNPRDMRAGKKMIADRAKLSLS